MSSQAQVKTSNTDDTTEIAAAVDLIHSIQAKMADLDQQATKALAAIADKEERLGHLVLDADDKTIDKASDEIERVKAQLASINLGQRAAQRRLEEARVALHKLTAANQIALFKRLTTARAKVTSEIADLISALHKAIKRAREHGEKISSAWGVDPPGGTLLRGDHILEAVSNEFMRVSRPPNPLGRGNFVIPGSREPLLTGGAKEMSLVDRVAQADQHIMRLIEKGPVIKGPNP